MQKAYIVTKLGMTKINKIRRLYLADKTLKYIQASAPCSYEDIRAVIAHYSLPPRMCKVGRQKTSLNIINKTLDLLMKTDDIKKAEKLSGVNRRTINKWIAESGLPLTCYGADGNPIVKRAKQAETVSDDDGEVKKRRELIQKYLRPTTIPEERVG